MLVIVDQANKMSRLVYKLIKMLVLVSLFN